MTDPMPILSSSLIDILYDLRESNMPLIIGGGYGIYLRREHVRLLDARTLLKQWPEARSTNDIDLFLRPELLIDSRKLKPLATSLKRHGYRHVTGAEKYQFVRAGTGGSMQGSIKIDLLTGPRSCFTNSEAKVDQRRVRPQPSMDLHAHPVDEAITLEDDLLEIPFSGRSSSGDVLTFSVFLPHPLTFCMMKLFAFRDRRNDPDKSFGQYHAMDIYAVIATTMDDEWNRAVALVMKYRNQPEILECRRIVGQFFSARKAEGILRLQESPYFRPDLELNDFISILEELFRPAPTTEVE